MRYKVSETYPCLITWTRIVEANSSEEALSKFNDGDGGEPDYSPEIGDMLDGYDLITNVEPCKVGE